MQPGEAIVVGAGLAGAAAAASLAARGWQVLVLDRADAPAAGASALPAGLMAPHHSTDDNLLSRLTRCGIRITLQQASLLLQKSDWGPCGVLQRRPRAVRLATRPDAGTSTATAAQLAAAGLAADVPALWHSRGAWIRPAALVEAWLRQPGVRFQGGCLVERIERTGRGWTLTGSEGRVLGEATLVVVAAAFASRAWLEQAVDLRPVRGQVAYGSLGDLAPLAPFPVNGNGHLLPDIPLDGERCWLTGSTYGHDDADAATRPADRRANLERLAELLPAAAAAVAPQLEAGQVRDWSGVRCVSRDRRPIVGALQPGLWITAAMGSRGLSFAALCAQVLAARIHGEAAPLAAELAAALDLARFRPA